MKGRVACEVTRAHTHTHTLAPPPSHTTVSPFCSPQVDAGDEMLVCELLFNGILSGLAPEVQSHVTGIINASPAHTARVTPQEQVLASLLSCIVGDMKADKEGDGGNR